MRANNCVSLVHLDSELQKASASVYDFDERQTERLRLRRIRALQHENALLARVAIEIRTEIALLRKSLTAS
jgi:hypothetical protein